MQFWELVIRFIPLRKQCTCVYNISVGGPSVTDDNTGSALMLQSMMNAAIHACDKETQGSSDAKKLDASVGFKTGDSTHHMLS